jgi:hypothetical protein
MFILSITLPNLSILGVPFLALLSTLIKRRRFQAKPATLPIPIDPLMFYWWRSFTVPGIKMATTSSYLMWGVVFHCLRNFFPLQ